jgi:chemotaxis protein histidine kinase CheA
MIINKIKSNLVGKLHKKPVKQETKTKEQPKHKNHKKALLTVLSALAAVGMASVAITKKSKPQINNAQTINTDDTPLKNDELNKQEEQNDVIKNSAVETDETDETTEASTTAETSEKNETTEASTTTKTSENNETAKASTINETFATDETSENNETAEASTINEASTTNETSTTDETSENNENSTATNNEEVKTEPKSKPVSLKKEDIKPEKEVINEDETQSTTNAKQTKENMDINKFKQVGEFKNGKAFINNKPYNGNIFIPSDTGSYILCYSNGELIRSRNYIYDIDDVSPILVSYKLYTNCDDGKEIQDVHLKHHIGKDGKLHKTYLIDNTSKITDNFIEREKDEIIRTTRKLPDGTWEAKITAGTIFK